MMVSAATEWKMALSCRKKFVGIGISSNNGDFHCLNCFHTEHIINLKNMKEYMIIMITVV